MMNHRVPLQNVDRVRLEETYDTIYKLQERLGVSDDYLLNATRGTIQDEENSGRLRILLAASIVARDNLTTWYLQTTLVPLNVAISLLTARMKFIEFKLGERDGLDLHQACSLSLVNFCNILSDMTVKDKDNVVKKNMHMVSNEVGIPVWLANYRNQICHVPSESPSISILVPLVVKSLDYLRDTFWAKVFRTETLDEQEFRNLFKFIITQGGFTSVNQKFELKKDTKMSKKRAKTIDQEILKLSKACYAFRRMLRRHPSQAMQLLTDLLVNSKPKGSSENVGLILEQVILTLNIKLFIMNLIKRIQTNSDQNSVSWLRTTLSLVNLSKKKRVKNYIRELGICPSNKIVRSIDISPFKCCQIAYELTQTDSRFVRGFILRLRYKLAQVIGMERVTLVAKIVRLAHSKSRQVPK